jgi:hypothetical protein
MHEALNGQSNKLKGADMATDQPETKSDDKLQFASLILYSSPPEASSLNDWVQDVEGKRKRNGRPAQEQSNSD